MKLQKIPKKQKYIHLRICRKRKNHLGYEYQVARRVGEEEIQKLIMGTLSVYLILPHEYDLTHWQSCA
jgi:hypothetical protein